MLVFYLSPSLKHVFFVCHCTAREIEPQAPGDVLSGSYLTLEMLGLHRHRWYPTQLCVAEEPSLVPHAYVEVPYSEPSPQPLVFLLLWWLLMRTDNSVDGY